MYIKFVYTYQNTVYTDIHNTCALSVIQFRLSESFFLSVISTILVFSLLFIYLKFFQKRGLNEALK